MLPLRFLQAVAVLNGIYAVHVLIDALSPHADGDPAIGILGDLWPTLLKATFWAAVTGWVVAGGILVWARSRGPVGPREQWIAAGALILPFAVYTLGIVAPHPGTLLLCLPSTAFGLWTAVRFQRWRRLPLRLVLACFAWGAVIASGFAAACNTLVMEYLVDYVGGLDMIKTMHDVYFGLFLNAGFGEEFGKGCALFLAYVLFRSRFDGPVTGVVLGAAVGLGFNLSETVEYMTHQGGAGYQYFVRQSVGLMAAHTAFSALLGAGFGVAALLPERRDRALAIAGGYLGAAGSHFMNNVVFSALSRGDITLPFTPGPTVALLLLTPLYLAVLQGPAVVLYLTLMRQGVRGQGNRLRGRIRDEARQPYGVISDRELTLLLDPRKRGWLRLTTLRRYGWAAYRALGQLQAAQYEVAALRDEHPGEAKEHRARARRFRSDLRAATAVRRAEPAGAPA
ncbi:Protease prsW [Actinoplanes sp. SE50]|nr:Protease prsW [Actinoplanes sp. SE50/110]ATO83919.1 Protease prsW [Actinoplanes sp. SE50]SLM01329.1 Protease prsW [Actinoplanes sp. SE50/110]